MFVSEALAVASATSIALSSMFISELKGRVPLMRLARWQFIIAFLMTGCISLALGGWRTVGFEEFKLLAASSFFGIAIASTTYFAAIYTAGPRLTALLFSLTSPFALAFGYAAYGETITMKQGVGVALVLAGIVLAIGSPRVGDGSTKAGAASSLLRWGILFGVITALGQALGGIFARPAMASGVEPFTAVALRAGLASGFFLLLALFPFGRDKDVKPFRFKDLGLSACSSFFGNCLGMSLLMAALESGDVGIVSTLSSMTPIVILPMVWARSGKPPSARAWAGGIVAIAGTALISLH